MPYVGEIRMFGGSFAPAGWAFCDGSLLPISENETLFNLIGTTYGGDGQETFQLPDLRGRAPVHMGKGPGVSNTYTIGQVFGTENVTVAVAQTPSHTHPLQASTDNATQITGENGVLASTVSVSMYYTGDAATPLGANLVTPVGGSQPHDNMQPYLVISYIISLFGVFPSQS